MRRTLAIVSKSLSVDSIGGLPRDSTVATWMASRGESRGLSIKSASARAVCASATGSTWSQIRTVER